MATRNPRPNDLRPTLGTACAHLGRELSELHRTVTPFVERVSEALHRTNQAVAPILAAIAQFSRIVDAVRATGWVPHRSLSLEEVASMAHDIPRLAQHIESHYLDRWTEIRRDITTRLRGYIGDDETIATFEEAFDAHDRGHYRCVCRVLFPEIERTIRLTFGVVDIGESLSRGKIEEVVNMTTLEEAVAGDPLAYSRFGLVAGHVYERVGPKDLGRVKSEWTPNRHAALHGLLIYSTKKHSINTIQIGRAHV